MKAEELRIGNIVGATIAGKIHGDLEPFVIESGIDIGNAKCFFPLELYEKWLFNFGFESIPESPISKRYIHRESYIMITCFSDIVFWVHRAGAHPETGIHAQHVHTLQNACFLMSDVELKLPEKINK